MSDMNGRVCLVTGATGGLGLATAEGLARRGAEVILHGRNEAKLNAATQFIRERTNAGKLRGVVADLSSLDEVRRLGAELNERAGPLHVLVNNAGVFGPGKTRDGFDLAFGVNHLAHFLLTNLLLEKIRHSAPARIVCVASVAHEGRPLDPETLDGPKGLFGLAAYGRSKFANILFANELARRLDGSGVTANALHPGLVSTGMLNAPPPPASWVIPLVRRFALSPEQGAKTSIYLATSPEVEGVSGGYFVKCRQVAPDPRTQDVALARRLWDRSAALAGLHEA
jgi:NAD(P)-dependent dehydrogenase (short-subunit alcohol dehydrogenase family)